MQQGHLQYRICLQNSSQTKLKFHEISCFHGIHFSLKILHRAQHWCRVYVESQKDLTTAYYIMGNRDFNRFQFKKSFGILSYNATASRMIRFPHGSWHYNQSVFMRKEGYTFQICDFIKANVSLSLKSSPLLWRHNGRDGFSNHQPDDCLLNCTFRRRSKKHQRFALLAFVRGIHRWPVNPPHKYPVTRKMLPFDDVIMVHTDKVVSVHRNRVHTVCWWNIGHCSETHPKLKSRKMSFTRNIHCSHQIVLKCCTEQAISLPFSVQNVEAIQPLRDKL